MPCQKPVPLLNTLGQKASRRSFQKWKCHQPRTALSTSTWKIPVLGPEVKCPAVQLCLGRVLHYWQLVCLESIHLCVEARTFYVCKILGLTLVKWLVLFKATYYMTRSLESTGSLNPYEMEQGIDWAGNKRGWAIILRIEMRHFILFAENTSRFDRWIGQ